MKKHGGVREGAGRPGPYGEKTKPIRLPISLIKSVEQFVQHKGYRLPLFSSKVPAGSAIALDDHIEEMIDLHSYLIKHPATTFLVRATGNSMINAGIHNNDILIVDRQLKATSGKIVIACIDGQLTVKRLHQSDDGTLLLMPENPNYKPIEIQDNQEIFIWGVVTNVIHAVL